MNKSARFAPEHDRERCVSDCPHNSTLRRKPSRKPVSWSLPGNYLVIQAPLTRRRNRIRATAVARAVNYPHGMSTEDAVTVVVVDDHPLYRRALGEVLADAGWVVAAQAGTLRQAKDLNVASADLALVDLQLPDGNGLELLSTYTCPVVTMSASAQGRDVHSSLQSGSRGYITKTAQALELMSALRTALNAPPGLTSHAKQELHKYLEVPGRPNLTARESELLAYLQQGVTTTRDLAGVLHVTERTVKAHLSSIYLKTGTRNRAELLAQRS